MIDQLPPIVLGAVIAAVSSLLVFALTQFFNLRSQSQQLGQRTKERHGDNVEWYRRTVFEKNLKAAEEAYAWVLKLNRAIGGAKPENPESEANAALRQMCGEAREWWDNNAIYLHDGRPGNSSFVGFTTTAGDYARAMESDTWHSFDEAYDEVRERIRALYERYKIADYDES